MGCSMVVEGWLGDWLLAGICLLLFMHKRVATRKPARLYAITDGFAVACIT